MTLSDDFSGPAPGLQWMTWRDCAGGAVNDGVLALDAKGSGPRHAANASSSGS